MKGRGLLGVALREYSRGSRTPTPKESKNTPEVDHPGPGHPPRRYPPPENSFVKTCIPQFVVSQLTLTPSTMLDGSGLNNDAAYRCDRLLVGLGSSITPASSAREDPSDHPPPPDPHPTPDLKSAEITIPGSRGATAVMTSHDSWRPQGYPRGIRGLP